MSLNKILISSPRLENDGMALAHVHTEFKDNEFFVSKALRNNGNALRFASKRLQQLHEMAFLACQTTAEAVRYVLPDLRNRALIASVVARNGDLLRYASRSLQDDKDIAIIAVRKHGEAIRFISKRLLFDEDILVSAAKQNSCSMRHVQLHLLKDSVTDAIIKANGCVARFIQLDKRRAILAVRSNGMALILGVRYGSSGCRPARATETSYNIAKFHATMRWLL